MDCLKTKDAVDLTSATLIMTDVSIVTVYILLNAPKSYLN